VSQDGREYYAVSKDFNLKEAWNRNQRDHGAYNSYGEKLQVKNSGYGKRAQTDMESLLQRNFRYCKYRAENNDRSG
jgi:hypothetical protein